MWSRECVCASDFFLLLGILVGPTCASLSSVSLAILPSGSKSVAKPVQRSDTPEGAVAPSFLHVSDERHTGTSTLTLVLLLCYTPQAEVD